MTTPKSDILSKNFFMPDVKQVYESDEYTEYLNNSMSLSENIDKNTVYGGSIDSIDNIPSTENKSSLFRKMKNENKILRKEIESL